MGNHNFVNVHDAPVRTPQEQATTTGGWEKSSTFARIINECYLRYLPLLCLLHYTRALIVTGETGYEL